MKKWISAVLFKHWITGILLLTLTASFSWFFFFQIKWKATTHQLIEYTQLYSPDCPAMLFTNDGIVFEPPTYKVVNNNTQLTLIFDPGDTLETLPTKARQGSLLFTPSHLTYRSSKKDHRFLLRSDDIKTDSLYISPELLSEFISQKPPLIGKMTFLIGWICVVITALILGFITAALFMGFDLLTSERLSWSSGYNLASVVLFFLGLLWYLQNHFNWHIPAPFAVLLFLFMLLSGIGLTLIHHFEASTPLWKSKKE